MRGERRGKLTVLTVVAIAASLAYMGGQVRRRPAAASPAIPDELTGEIALTGVSLVSMEDDRVAPDQTVLVRDGRIAAIGPAGSGLVPASAQVIAAEGRFLIPGLTDAHTHVAFEEDLVPYVANGVTTILNLGNEPDVPILSWRDEVSAGERLGPTIFVARFVDGARARNQLRNTYLLATAGDARRFVSETVASGYDFIKVYNSLSAPVYYALLEEARAAGIAVVGHGVRSVGMDGLLAAGQVMVAHGEEYLYTQFRDGLEEAEIESAVEMTARARAYVIPNLSAYEAIALQWGKPAVLEELLELPGLRYTHPFWRSYWSRGRYTSRQGDLSANLEFLRTLTRKFSDAGVPLLVGTDSPPIPGMLPGFSIHEDLRNLVESGLTPYEALAAGTRNPGRFFTAYVDGADPFGTISVGARADLVLLEADPLADVENVKRRAGVMVRGRWFSEGRLSEMLNELAAGHAGEPDG